MRCAFPIPVHKGTKLPGGTNALGRHSVVEAADLVPCGRCMPCRINLRRKKTARFLLEAKLHRSNSFVTLTLTEEEMFSTHTIVGDDGAPEQTVRVAEMQKWMKRVRKARGPTRFVYVGEYGNRTGRAHYHAILFGVDPREAYAVTSLTWRDRGRIEVSELKPERAQYTAGYTAKKLTKPDDYRLHSQQEPEFMRQSLKPAIGVPYVERLARVLNSRGAAQAIAERGDVPREVRINGKLYPLDRTMVRYLREAAGVDFPDVRPIERRTTDEDAEAKAFDRKARRRGIRGKGERF